MDSIKNAIEEFKNRRLGVYKADPDQIVRDTRVAERATKDHVGRWLFELLQNSDDAEASEVGIIIEENTIYVADNGKGLESTAVSAICGTDFSDKTAGTIGRKGVGFKSVYEVSRNPQVLTVDGEGIEFSPDRTTAWLQENNLDDGHVPYQWIPFLIPWDHVQRQDQQLGALRPYKTVVRLRGLSPEKKQKVEQLLREWPPHALFAFRHLRQIKAPGLEVVLSAGDGVWSLRDSRGETPVEWRVSRHAEHPPADLLEGLGADERQALSADGVGFLIAAPLENDCVVPTTDYLPVHVFYPTEQKGPVRLLLHAEFLVKSDRTALIPIADNPFNAWVADRLAYHVCKFVNDSYRPESPSRHAALLVPFGDRASHPVAKDLWQRIADRAKTELRLPDIEGRQRLTVGQARLLSVSVCPDLARSIQEVTEVRKRLLHRAFDEDKEARRALRELGSEQIGDQDLMDVIAENASALAADSQWIWACWAWLAAWIAKEPYGEKHRERVERVKALPLTPIDGRLLRPSDLEGHIVTWRGDNQAESLPDWLPLTFVDEWFRDRIQATREQEATVGNLCKKLDIKEPGRDAVQRAVGRAVEQYWDDEQGDPARFLRFILKQDWYETSEASSALQRCPVPLSKPIEGQVWAEARKAYFGREWGNTLLSDLYAGMENIAWVRKDAIENSEGQVRRVLEWLGVTGYPRVVDDPSGQAQESLRVQAALPYNTAHDPIPHPKVLEHVSITRLPPPRSVALLRLLTKHWTTYYAHHSTLSIRCRYYGWHYHSAASAWWDEIKTELPLPLRGSAEPVPLGHCWLPDKRTKRAIGGLLPVVDLDAFVNDKDAVQDWLISAVGLRTRIEQLSIEEWKALLSRHIPDKAPVERLVSEERLRDKVTGWYTACLETMAEQDNVSERVFTSCPFLCRKGDMRQYVANEPRFLDDDNYLAEAFAKDVWLFHIPARLAADAVQYSGIPRLSQSVGVNVTPGEPQSPLSGDLNVRFSESLPYVWAWRSSQSKQAADMLSVRLKGLEVIVVPALKASLSLDGLHHEVERPWHVNDHTIYLQKDHANEAELAEALAKALDVKSEADFYENLLRCTDDRQRKTKLLSKSIADAEIDRCLREYTARPAEEEHDEGRGKPTKDEQGGSTSQAPSSGGSQVQQGKQSLAAHPGETSEGTSSGSQDSVKQPLRLKYPSTTLYVIGSPPSGGAGPGGSGEGGGTEREGRSLTDAEKAELEKAGRVLAARELESMGFSVEKMPQGNPGFDLLARKDGDELRVEVKAHSGRAAVVDVTQREYKEYLRQQGYRWELWNVEHLAENDPSPVVITRYDRIPDDALNVRTFRVDLKRCQTSLDPTEHLT